MGIIIQTNSNKHRSFLNTVKEIDGYIINTLLSRQPEMLYMDESHETSAMHSDRKAIQFC